MYSLKITPKTGFGARIVTAVLAAVLLLFLIGCRESTSEFPTYTAPSSGTTFGKVCEELIDEYRTMLNVSEMDWNANGDAYAAEYPRVNRTYIGFYHLGLIDTLYAAFYDIDGNGTDEFFIGLGDRHDPMEVGVYAFTGDVLVPLSLTDTADGYQIFTDGTFLQSDGSGAVTAIKRIAPDGCSLENTDSAILSVGNIPEEEDLTALGGHLYLESWAKVPLTDQE